MSMNVGHDWDRLPPLERSRQILAQVFEICLQEGEKYFVEAAGRTLSSGAWPADAPHRAAPHYPANGWLGALFAPNARVRVSPWEQLAADLPEDSDFRAWVRKAARKWLRCNDEYTLRDVTIAFAFEGHACTVDHAELWYRDRGRFTGTFHRTWIKQLEAKLGNKPISRLVKTETGRRPSEGEGRNGTAQGPYIGTSVTSLTGRDDAAGMALLDHQDDLSDDPVDLCIQREQIERLESAIQALPDQLRAAFVQRFLESRTRREVGASLDLSETEVTNRCQLALKQLKQILTTTPRKELS